MTQYSPASVDKYMFDRCHSDELLVFSFWMSGHFAFFFNDETKYLSIFTELE